VQKKRIHAHCLKPRVGVPFLKVAGEKQCQRKGCKKGSKKKEKKGDKKGCKGRPGVARIRGGFSNTKN